MGVYFNMTKISIIGGDLRIIKFAEMLSEEGFEVYTYGLEQSELINKNDKIIKCNSLDEIAEKSKIAISSIPLSSNGINVNMPFSEQKLQVSELENILDGKVFIAGRIKDETYEKLKNTKIIDLLKREELTVLNTIATAEGAIQVAMEETTRTLHGSNILIMGFGRISKVLSNMLKGIGANVYCETTKTVNTSWIKAYGYTPVLFSELNDNLGKFDIIINTVPHIILDDSNLDYLKKDCVIIDVASTPGGVDKKAAKTRDLKLIWALSLPGKVAPTTSAEYIKDTFYNVIRELEIQE